MTDQPAACFNCGNQDKQLPLVHVQYKGEQFYVCPGCMPSLIHRSESVADKIEAAYAEKTAGNG